MFRILTTLYNCEEYIERCLRSISEQYYTDWRCYVIDDSSEDNSAKIIHQVIDKKFEYIHSNPKRFQIGNFYNVIQNFEPEDICLVVDGDDWLPDKGVFDRIATAYDDESTWITCGSAVEFWDDHTQVVMPLDVPTRMANFYNWWPTHLKTWKVRLWNQIPIEHLQDKDSQFYKVASDIAFMLSMLKIAGPRHYRKLTQINYCYNAANPLSNHILRRPTQLEVERIIRSNLACPIFL